MLRERVSALPGVTSVSYSVFLPLTMHSNGTNIQVDDGKGNKIAVVGAHAGSVGKALPGTTIVIDRRNPSLPPADVRLQGDTRGAAAARLPRDVSVEIDAIAIV